jgi:BolA protein
MESVLSLAEEVQKRLAVLSPEQLCIEDESALHAGHKGNNGGGHFKVTIVSACFNGKTQIARHRMVYQSLAGLIPECIHALSIQAYSPDEFT